jgi:hypothetical protein
VHVPIPNETEEVVVLRNTHYCCGVDLHCFHQVALYLLATI